MNKTIRFIAIGLLAALVSVGHAGNNDKIVMLATTTSTQNSGLLEYLLPEFQEQSGLEVRVIAVGTGKALRMGEDGDVDLLMVHAKPAEEKFVAAGHGLQRHELMYNDFVLVGPEADPAGLNRAGDINEAMKILSRSELPFISRGDDSGTHKKELSLWKQAGVSPNADTYRELGQGMGKTVQVANELQGYTMIDRGTWLSSMDKLDLVVLFEGDPMLFNQYAAIRVNPEPYPDLNSTGAQLLIDWLVSEEGQALIGDFKVKGKVLFKPNAKQQ